MKSHIYLPLVLLVIATIHANSQTITVGSGGDYPTLSDAESHISAGDTVIVLDGIYSHGTQFLNDLHGTIADPIVIKADHEHQAIFRGGTEAIHLVNCTHLEIHGLIVEQQTGNGINIDDGGDYYTPTHHITIDRCIFRDMNAGGNNDLLKLSGLDSFSVRDCQFLNGGGGGSGVDMVGCHYGIIEDNYFDDSGTSGIQAKGGTQHILMQRNVFKNIDQRAVNLGGSTGLTFFRPPLPNPIVDVFEAADLEVYSNIFIGSWSPIAYVGCVRVKVVNNTIYKPENWVIRILQETTESGFLTCADNIFRSNAIYLEHDLTEVNIGPNTDPNSFILTNNLWYNEQSSSWTPTLPVTDSNQVLANPQFSDPTTEDFSIPAQSPCVSNGKVVASPKTDFVQFFFASPPSIGAHEGDASTTAIPYVVGHASIVMGPNPAANQVTVTGEFSDAMIQVLNASGQLVQDYSNASPPLTIYLDQLPDGLYFIKIASETYPMMWMERILKVD